MHINLLPASTRLAIQFDKKLRVYMKCWMAIGAVATIYLIYQLFLGQRLQQELAGLEKACEPVRQTQSQIHQQRLALAKLVKKQETLSSLRAPSNCVSILGSIVQAIASQPGKVYLQRLSLQVEDAPPKQPQANQTSATRPQPLPSQAIVIMGQADNDASLSKLITDMRQSGWMSKVELKSSSRSTTSAARQFHIEATHSSTGRMSPITSASNPIGLP